MSVGDDRAPSALDVEKLRLDALLAAGEEMLAAARETIADIDSQLGMRMPAPPAAGSTSPTEE